MEDSKSNEDSPNKSTLSDEDKSPSPKITLFEKHEVVKLENTKLKEKQESNIQADLTKEQKEAADCPPDLTEHLPKDDSSKDPLQGESKENVCPGRKVAPDLTKEQAEAADTQVKEKHCQSQKNSMNREFSDGTHPNKNGQEGNIPEDLNKEQAEVTKTHAEETGTHLHIQKNSVGGELQNEENSDKNGQEGNIPADLAKEQTEAADMRAKEPGFQLHIQKNSVNDKLSTEDSPEMNRQEVKNPADLKDQNKDLEGLHRMSEGNCQGLENNLKGELPVTKSLESNHPESNSSNRNKDRSGDSHDNGSPKEHRHAHEDSTKSVEKNDQIITSLNLTKCQLESDEHFDGKPEKHLHAKKDSLGEIFVGEPLGNDVVIDNLPDLEYDPLKVLEDKCEFPEHVLSDSSKSLPPVHSLSTESVTKKDKICICPQFYKLMYPNVCPCKFKVMPEATIVPLNCSQPVLKDPPERSILDAKSSFETEAAFLAYLDSDESGDETDSQPINLTGFTKEFCDELFSNLEAAQDAWSETDCGPFSHFDDQQPHSHQQSHNPFDRQSPASEVPYPIFPVPTVLADLHKKKEAHKQYMVSKLAAHDFLHAKDDAETQRDFSKSFDKCVEMINNKRPDSEDYRRARELFKIYLGSPSGSPVKRARIPSSSSSDGLYASSGYGRYVRLSPTDVVSLKIAHFGVLTSLKSKLLGYSSSIRRDDGPFAVRSVRKLASSALEAVAAIAEGMKEKVEDDIKFYNDNYVIDTLGMENLDL